MCLHGSSMVYIISMDTHGACLQLALEMHHGSTCHWCRFYLKQVLWILDLPFGHWMQIVRRNNLHHLQHVLNRLRARLKLKPWGATGTLGRGDPLPLPTGTKGIHHPSYEPSRIYFKCLWMMFVDGGEIRGWQPYSLNLEHQTQTYVASDLRTPFSAQHQNHRRRWRSSLISMLDVRVRWNKLVSFQWSFMLRVSRHLETYSVSPLASWDQAGIVSTHWIRPTAPCSDKKHLWMTLLRQNWWTWRMAF